MAGLADYLARITSEHAAAPDFNAAVAAAVQPFCDMQVGILGMPQLYDLDNAVGAQLDTVGLWIGAPRLVTMQTPPLFSFDVSGRGFDEGWWDYPGSRAETSIRLADPAYRVLLRARVVNNHWNGSIPEAYAIWNTLFQGTGLSIRLWDRQDMTMAMDLVCPAPPDPVISSLFYGGLLDVKPAGVEMMARTLYPGAPPEPGGGSLWDGGASFWDAGGSVWDTTT